MSCRPPVVLLVRGRICDVRASPVNADQSPELVEPATSRHCERLGDLREGFNHHRRAKTRARLENRGLRRHLPNPETARDPVHTPSSERITSYYEPAANKAMPSRNRPSDATAAACRASGLPGVCDHPVDHIGREGARQNTQRDVVTHTFRGPGLNPSAADHAPILTEPRLSKRYCRKRGPDRVLLRPVPTVET